MQTATNPDTGETVVLVGSEWKRPDKVATNDSGAKAYLIGNQWLSDEKSTSVQPMLTGKPGVPRELSLTDRILAKMPDIGMPQIGLSPQNTQDIAAGASGLMRGGANLLFPGLGEKIWPKAGSTDSVARSVGSFIDPVAIAAGGVVGKALPYAPVFGKGVIEGAKAMGRNIFAGGITGGAIGGLSEDDTADQGVALGAGIGAALPIVSLAGKSIGTIIDVLTGKHAKIQAADILREAAGMDLPTIRTSMGAAKGDLTATQAAAKIDNDTWNALGELAVAADKTSYFSRLASKQKQKLIDAVRAIANAKNQTEALHTSEAMKDSLNTITKPMRDVELGAANIAGQTGTRLQNEADRLGAAASSKVEDVRRLGNAEQIANDVAQSGRTRLNALPEGNPPVQGLPRISGRYSYSDELAKLAERISKKPADDSLILGEASRFAQRQVDSLASHGLKPINTGRIIGTIYSKLNDPSIAGNSVAERVLSKVSDTILTWTEKAGGVIDAEALYAIRKNAVNSEIETMMGSADPKLKAKYASKLLSKLNPIIDDAIVAAGGAGWRNYLQTYSQGMHQINQQKMGAKVLSLLETQPKKLESLAAGNEPKMVQKIFQTEYDLATAMGDKVKPINAVAEAIARDRMIKESASRGQGGLERILKEHHIKINIPNWINREVAITNRALSVMENWINKHTMEAVYEAMRSGKTANQLLDVIPAKERIHVINAMVASRPPAPVIGGGLAGILSNQQPQQ